MNHPLSIALIGNPNCGKTALFNRLTGSHQKDANYAGVTVERKEGSLTTEAGRQFHIIDLPGIYSLTPLSQDEEITRSALIDKTRDIPIDLVVFVADATNLKRSLKLIIDVIQLGYPTVLALNMTDLARKSGQVVDLDILQKELGIPIVETTAIQSDGIKSLLDILDKPESLIRFVTDRPGHDLRYAIDPAKIHAELGWLPETTFDEGIRRTVRWYLSHKEWWRHIISGEYRNYYAKMYEER